MRVFISELTSSLAAEVARLAQDAGFEVTGTVATKAQLARVKRKLMEHPSSDQESALPEPVALQSDKSAWSKLVQSADVVITSVVDNSKLAMETLKVFEKPRGEDDDSAGVKRFIAVSSVLTWSRNPVFAKENSPEGPIGHREDDFKTRKPIRKYADLKTVETQILSANRPDELETCVVAAGLLYGGAQSNLHLLFRNAWMYPNRDLTVPSVAGGVKGGHNLIPMISIYDLALVLARLASAATAPPKNYLLAVDLASRTTTLRDICSGVSILLGNGRVRDLASPEEGDELLLEEDDGMVAPLQLHLSFDVADAAVNQLVEADEWKHRDGGLLGNLTFFVDDYIQAMDLRPLKTVVLGPPRVGKTKLGAALARTYYLPHLTPANLIRELYHDSETEPQQQQQQQVEGEGEGGDQTATTPPDVEVAKLREQLVEWRDGEGKPYREIPNDVLVALLRWKLSSANCRNQGYVLDGLPTCLTQAQGIFELIKEATEDSDNQGAGGEGDANAEGENPTAGAGVPPSSDADDGETSDSSASLSKSPSRLLLARLKPTRQIQAPNRVIVLNAPRELLEHRAQELTEEAAEATNNTQAAFELRLEEFTAEIEHVAHFFEKGSVVATPAPEADGEKEGGDAEGEAVAVPPPITNGIEVLELHLDSESAFLDNEAFNEPIKKYMEQGGSNGRLAPCNFHPTREELRQQQRDLEAKQREDEERSRQEASEQEEKEEANLRSRLAAEKARLEIIEREEAALLEARAKPLRAYLMDTVLPALTEGMLEVVKVQPDDPIDYLAEFLFKKGQEMADAPPTDTQM